MNRRHGLRLFLACLLAMLCTATTAAEFKPFKLNVTLTTPLGTPQRNGLLNQVVDGMLRRVGYEPIYAYAHEERGLRNLDEGLDDGNLPRVAGLERLYPNIRQVPGKVMDFHFQVFATDPELKVDGWRSLDGLEVAFVTGWKILEENVRAHTITKVATSKQLFQLLAKGRTQAVIYEKWQGLELIRALGLRGIHAVEPPLITKEMFLYVNRCHEALIPRLSEALAAMKIDGEYARIERETLGSYLQP